MEKYIISLLELNKRVIVSGLGAFIIRQQEPQELIFNDLLAFDDGMLTDLIMQEDDKSKAEARDSIRQYVEKVKTIMEGGETYKLENIGSLIMDASGKIEFSTSETMEELPAEKDETKDEAAEEEKDIAEETRGKAIEESMPEPEETSLVSPDEEVEPDGEEEGFVLADGDADVDVDATVEETPLEADREEPPFSLDESTEAEAEQEAEVPYESPLNKTETPEPEENPFSAYTQPSQNRKKAWPWIPGSAIVVLVLVAAAWFMFPEMLNNIFHKEVTELVLGEESATSESDSEIPHDLDAEGTSAEVEEPPKAVPVETPGNREPVSAVRPSGKQYYVVAGCFSELKNAENYVQTLRDNGYDASVFGMRKNLHTVCFNSHTSKQAAIEELYRIQDSYDPHVWVLYY